MAPLAQPQPDGAASRPASVTLARVHAQALVQLSREVWHPDCTFDSAVGLICETAARVLQVERVNVWRYDPRGHRLECLHAYSLSDGVHRTTGGEHPLEVLPLDADYFAALNEVRAIDADDVRADPSTTGSTAALRDYLRRNDIRALLDAPVRVEGELIGVLCHESVGTPRRWTDEDVSFAASMGDFVAITHEIARRRRAEAEVRHLRLHDAGTGLPNRDYLVELIAQRLAAPWHPRAAPAVVHLRVDAAHASALVAGTPTLEDVMAQVALRLRQFTHNELNIARVRSDAFAVIAPRGAGQTDVIRIAERCLNIVRGMPRLHESLEVTAAAGVAFASGEGDEPRILLRKAEQAADRAFEQGPLVFEVFDLHHHEELVERLRTERALREAFAGGALEVHYQPEYDTGHDDWSAAEALLRWRTADGLATAASFIGVAEASGLILSMGAWVLREACRAAAGWPDGRAGARTVRVNVSARQFDQGDGLVQAVREALADAGLAPVRLCLEITETALMRDIDQARAVLHAVRALGVKVAIDDFGTGYSSLAYLKTLPVDYMKLDRTFVEGVAGDAVDLAIVSALVGLASSLAVEVVAEGVERSDQQQALQGLGVTRMQGWLYAPAIEGEALLALFEEGRPLAGPRQRPD